MTEATQLLHDKTYQPGHPRSCSKTPESKSLWAGMNLRAVPEHTLLVGCIMAMQGQVPSSWVGCDPKGGLRCLSQEKEESYMGNRLPGWGRQSQPGTKKRGSRNAVGKEKGVSASGVDPDGNSASVPLRVAPVRERNPAGEARGRCTSTLRSLLKYRGTLIKESLTGFSPPPSLYGGWQKGDNSSQDGIQDW